MSTNSKCYTLQLLLRAIVRTAPLPTWLQGPSESNLSLLIPLCILLTYFQWVHPILHTTLLPFAEMLFPSLHPSYDYILREASSDFPNELKSSYYALFSPFFFLVALIYICWYFWWMWISPTQWALCTEWHSLAISGKNEHSIGSVSQWNETIRGMARAQ